MFKMMQKLYLSMGTVSKPEKKKKKEVKIILKIQIINENQKVSNE